jgi:hypothetical protein
MTSQYPKYNELMDGCGARVTVAAARLPPRESEPHEMYRIRVHRSVEVV